MKTSKLSVLAALFGSSVLLMVAAAQTPETLPRSPFAALPVDIPRESSLQRAALLQGITQVGGVTPVSAGANAAVGALGISQPNGFAVLERGAMAVVAASSLGNGRVVAFGHTDLFMNAGFANASSARLLENAARWVSPGKAAPRILVLDNEALATFFEQRGFASSNLISGVAQQQLSDLDVVALFAYTPLTTAEVRALESFAENGGGLLVAGQAWSWLHWVQHSSSSRRKAGASCQRKTLRSSRLRSRC